MQSYLLPYHVASSGEKIVLMGLKNIIGYKANNITQTDPIVWNNAGQWVISGGGKDSKDSNELAAAMREFFEETGVDLRVRNVREEYIKTLLFPLSSSRKNFSVSYIRFEDYSGLSQQINKNIINKNVADDELREVTWIRSDAAKKSLGSPQLSTQAWMKGQIDALLKWADGDKMKLADADKKWRRQTNLAWDWFEVAIDNLP